MVFMDFRDYDDGKPEEGTPSFLYVMPMSSTQVFFEVGLFVSMQSYSEKNLSLLALPPLLACFSFGQETCLAARPLLPFGELKDRLYRRLKKMNFKITQILEEVMHNQEEII
jgi:lycopene epsilon-cyclase